MLNWEEPNPQSYIVRPGDTLFGIAWVYKVDRDRLAWANGIVDHTKLQVGQKLRLDVAGLVGAPRKRPSGSPANTVARTPVVASNGRSPAPEVKTNRSAQQPRPANSQRQPKPSSGRSLSVGKWVWPYSREIARNYGAGRHGRDGLGFKAVLGEKIHAASLGKVVYVGDHHKQLGGLVVIHHADDMVSAYAFCGRMLVTLGQKVKAGQHIADVGYNPKGEPAFNFGIRKDGKPLDVLAYLPKR